MRDDQYGEVIMYGCDIDGNADGKTHHYPTYTCGHCSSVVVMRADRTRERVRCSSCDKLICEKSELCRQACTPIHALARDHFEGDPKWTRLVPALMAGATTEEEAIRRGLIKT